MSIGSLSQDPLFQAFSSSTNSSSVVADGHESMAARSTGGGSFPTGSRLFTYMQPAQVSRKSSSEVQTSNAMGAAASSPSSPPQFVSGMSPFANAFHPSSNSSSSIQSSTSNKPPYGQRGDASSSLEQRFAQSMNMRDHEFPPRNQQQQQQIPPHPFDAAALHIGHSGSTPAFNSYEQPASSMLHHYAANDFNSTGSTAPNSTMNVRRKAVKSPVAPYGSSNIAVESIGGTTYFYNTPPMDAGAQGLHGHEEHAAAADGNPESNIVMPDYYTYTGPPSNVGHYKPRMGMGYFAPNEIKSDLIHRQLLCMAQVDPEEFPDLPQEVDCYHRLVPLESSPSSMSMMPERLGYFNMVTNVYKANSTKNGLAYCLRRIHNYRLTNMRCLSVIEAWKKLQHSNIVQIREVFTTKGFGDNCVVFVYDYYPGAETLKSKHFARPSASANGFMDDLDQHLRHPGQPPRMITPKGVRIGGGAPSAAASMNGGSGNGGGGGGGLLPEAFIWCYIIQLSSALRLIHSMGLAARTIDPSKILVVGKSRLLVNCCGISDLLQFDQVQQQNMLQAYQQEDLVGFGRVVLALASNNPMVFIQQNQWQSSIEFVARHYSPDLKNLIVHLIAPQQRIRNVNDVMPMIGARFYTQLETAQTRVDLLENELTKEVDNGRLFRLICKLGSINERLEHAMDSQWSETGDRYLLKLFRDYLFHQVAEDGRPWLDMAHVVQCLNKLDAGVPEKLTLSSRDQQNVLIVSYADLHRCLEQAFEELSRHNASMDMATAAAAHHLHHATGGFLDHHIHPHPHSHDH